MRFFFPPPSAWCYKAIDGVARSTDFVIVFYCRVMVGVLPWLVCGAARNSLCLLVWRDQTSLAISNSRSGNRRSSMHAVLLATAVAVLIPIYLLRYIGLSRASSSLAVSMRGFSVFMVYSCTTVGLY